MVLRYIGIYLATMIFDYARIYVIETDETKMLIALKQGFLFVFRNLIRTAGFVFLIVIIGVVVLILYNLIANILALPNVFVIILLLLVQQAYMIFRMMLRLTLFAGQVHLYQNIDSEEVLLASGDVAVE